MHSLPKFNAAVAALGGTVPAADVYRALVAAWALPDRAYHTLQHLDECLTLVESWGSHLTRAEHAILTLALWYHDAVYDPRGTENEQLSAQRAEAELARLGASHRARIVKLVLATEHSTPVPPGDPLVDLLLDIDLAILGAPAERFTEYEAQIRREYAWVDDAAYSAGRSKVMAHFRALACAEPPTLYRTAAGRTLLAQARANLGASE